MSPPKFGVVLLTMGRRPEDLARGLASLQSQVDVDLDIVVVGNGWEPIDLPVGVKAHWLQRNLGIPAGRNAGVPEVQGDLLFFLDDDAALADDQFLSTIAQRFASDPTLGLIQPRVVDPTGLAAPGRWVPRLRVGDPAQPGPATSLWEGAVAIRRELFDRIGGWPDEFFYAHEGIDLVWRVWDEGFTPWYAGDLVVHHPVIDPARHEEYYRLNARNRVWLARRNLPLVLEPFYVGTWVGMTLLRVRGRKARRAWFEGLSEGIRERPAGRKVMHWSTVWAMTKAGRPPVI
ncbi:MAG: glycosyltransferase [Actinomycetota bacterium]|nr:glycosyltransferase [Actinomycetota bacterium]